jgi:hypothetical protein
MKRRDRSADKRGDPAIELGGRLSPEEVRIVFEEIRKKRKPKTTVASALDAWGRGAKKETEKLG